MTTRRVLAEPVERALQAARTRDGVISRTELRAFGVDRFAIRNHVVAGRWHVHGRQTISTHTGELSTLALRWRAIYEVSPRIAVLDGITALQTAGLDRFDDVRVHVSVPHGSRPRPVNGVRIHQVRNRDLTEVLTDGIPRVRPDVAAVRAAHWAVSDRQAALVLCLAVQQRLVSNAALVLVAEGLNGQRRRTLIRRVARDLAAGAHSLGELDFACLCRRRGLPEPDRQVVINAANGRLCLDVRWTSIGLVVVFDGSQHRGGVALTDDYLRQNAVTLSGDVVLRIDLVGLRLCADQFLDRVCRAHAELTARSQGNRHARAS